MTDDIKKLYSKMSAFEDELSTLRQGYVSINKRYVASLNSLKVDFPDFRRRFLTSNL